MTLRVLRILAASLGAAALADAAVGSTDLGHFFSFFTIESNILACGVLAVAALAAPSGRAFAQLRGAATLFMIITGLIYALLLSGHDVGLIAPWVNDTLHQVLPAYMLLDWTLAGPWSPTTGFTSLRWLLGPLAFLIYSLARGPIVDWYPYPFLDPRRSGGYPRVILTSLALALLMAALAMVVAWIAARRRSQPARRHATGLR